MANAYNAPFPMREVPAPTFPYRRFVADRYPSIQTAIDICAEAGGGTVVVPAGHWHTGPIHLRSGVCLHLSKDSVLEFSAVPEDYLPTVFTRWEGTECYNYSPLLYANGCENIAVTGTGTLEGNGKAWWGWKKLQDAGANAVYDAAVAGIPVEQRVYGTREAALRPSFLQFINCKRVLIEGITLHDGPQWTVHPVYCEEMTIRGIHVHTAGPNTDGLNPDSCKNVLIEDSDFCTGDDCIAINAGLNEDGWRVDKPSENIVIRDCTMTGGHGAIVVGSAISGCARNIYAERCTITGTMQGLRLKSMRGRGGTVENVWFKDIRIDDVENEAIQVNMFYEFSTVMPKTQTPSVFRNICFENITGEDAPVAVQLKGLPEQKLQGIILRNIDLTAQQALVCSDITGLTLEQCSLRSSSAMINTTEKPKEENHGQITFEKAKV